MTTGYDQHRALVLGFVSGSVLTLAAAGVYRWLRVPKETSDIADGVDGLIGNTPLVKIKSLSDATGCTILGKAEFLNPGGSSKDRVALNIVRAAEEEGALVPNKGCMLFEGTVGSTGISLAMIARARGYQACIVMPDDQAQEKYQLLEKLGAIVKKVRPIGINDRGHFVNVARESAAEFSEGDAAGYFANQFENEANFRVHYATTGPEIYRQTAGKIDAIVLGAGTGGTLSGLACYLKPLVKNLKVFLADPPGSGLFNKVMHNVMYAATEKEGARRRHQVDTVVEGIGLNRLTHNFDLGRRQIDGAFRVTDDEAAKMARFLVREDGLFVGSSTAVNCVAAVRAARELGPGHVIVTMLNDSGQRHLSKFWNDEYLASKGIDFELLPEHKLHDIVGDKET